MECASCTNDFWMQASDLDELKRDKANLEKDIKNGEKKLQVGVVFF